MSSHVDEDAESPTEPAAQIAAAAPTAQNAAPTLAEVTQLTRHELGTAQNNDSIVECGRAALALLHTNPDLARKLAYQKLHDLPYKEVGTCWRRLYTDASLWRVLAVTEARGEEAHTNEAWLDEVVKLLDMALILTAAPGREELVELWFAALEEELAHEEPASALLEPLERPAKRRKLAFTTPIPATFPNAPVEPASTLRHPIPRSDNPSLSSFQKKLSNPASHTPLIITNAIHHWPALSSRPWNSPSYLLTRTLGGRRLVPIETGRSYTDSGWGQSITSFGAFLQRYMLSPSTPLPDENGTGYLAQHDLFAQIPALRADMSVPDFCFTTPDPHLPANIPHAQTLADPILNAWFGPKGTVSPLHTDPYHNILAQVVGCKYIRCYKPELTAAMYPRGMEEGVHMGNTSAVDLDEAMGLFPEIGRAGGEGGADNDETEHRRSEFENEFPAFRDAEYVEAVLRPGDCLYLPPGWWHYVRGLSASCSVSFWFT